MLQTSGQPVLVSPVPVPASKAGLNTLDAEDSGIFSGVFGDILKDLGVLEGSESLAAAELPLLPDGSVLPLDGNPLPVALVDVNGISLSMVDAQVAEMVVDAQQLTLESTEALPVLDEAAMATLAGMQRFSMQKELPADTSMPGRLNFSTSSLPHGTVPPLVVDQGQAVTEALSRSAQLLMTEKAAADGATAFTKNMTELLKAATGSNPLAMSQVAGLATPSIERPAGFTVPLPVPAVGHGIIHTPVGQPGWDQELGNRVGWMMRQNVPMAEIKLTPANLGPVEIKISVVNDQATVTMTAAHSVTRDALEVAMPRLREMLADSGITLTNANVFAQSQQQGGQQSGQSSSGQPSFQAGQSGAGVEEDKVLATTQVSSNGMVDLFA